MIGNHASYLIHRTLYGFLGAFISSTAIMSINGMADSVLMGHLIGPEAVSAIQNAVPVMGVIASISLLISTGASVIATKRWAGGISMRRELHNGRCFPLPGLRAFDHLSIMRAFARVVRPAPPGYHIIRKHLQIPFCHFHERLFADPVERNGRDHRGHRVSTGLFPVPFFPPCSGILSATYRIAIMYRIARRRPKHLF